MIINEQSLRQDETWAQDNALAFICIDDFIANCYNDLMICCAAQIELAPTTCFNLPVTSRAPHPDLLTRRARSVCDFTFTKSATGHQNGHDAIARPTARQNFITVHSEAETTLVYSTTDSNHHYEHLD